jgi:hypothetical protein
MKIAGSGSGSISQRHGSADPDPDSHQNAMDSHHLNKLPVPPLNTLDFSTLRSKSPSWSLDVLHKGLGGNIFLLFPTFFGSALPVPGYEVEDSFRRNVCR